MRTKRLQKLTQELGLTNDQAAKVKAIFEAKSAEMSDLRAKYEGQPSTPENKAAMEKSHKALHAEIEAKLAQVLTAEQMTKYKQMRAEHMRKEGSKEEKAEAKEGSK